MTVRRIPSLLVAISLALTALEAAAQIGGQGAISGTITDPAGAVIQNATVTATNIRTNLPAATTTTRSGYFLLSPLPPGEYTVTVSADGFAQLIQRHVIVDALETVGFNPTLSVGAATQSVVVSAAPPLLETENGTLGTTMEQTEYTNLPLNMSNAPRNPTTFVGLMNGVEGGSGRSGEFNGSSSAGYLDEVYVDGVALTAPVQQGDNRGVAYTVAPEAVEQFQAQTSGSPVEYEGQGIQNYVIKSGTNEIHGSVFGYLRNTVFDTWGFAGKISSRNSVTGLPVKPVEHNREIGGAAGGPILRNRLFAFGSYDNFEYTSTPNPTQLTIPTARERSGDFSELPYPIYDPATTAACTAANNNVPCRYQFPGDVIPPNRISAVSQKLAQALPAPTNAEISDNYFSAITGGNTYWKSAERLDYDVARRQRLSGILLVGKYGTIGPDYTSKLPLPYGTAEYVSQFSTTAVVEHNYAITPHLDNQFKYAFNRLSAPDINATLNTPYTAASGGLGGLPSGEASSTFPAISFSGGVDNPTGWHAITGSVSNNEVVNTYVLLDNLQWIHGNHSFTFGGQIQWLEDNYKYPNNSASYPMSYTFNSKETSQFYLTGSQSGSLDTADTGVAYASFLLGAVDESSLETTAVPETGARFRTYSPYAEDDYRVTRRLTVNLGLRWNLWTPYREVHNRTAYMNPTLVNPLTGSPGALEYYGSGENSCHCSSPIALWWKNLAPRVGFAYSLGSKMVVRGAYGISYARDAAEGGHNSFSRTGASQQGYSGTSTLSGSADGTPAFNWDSSVANGPTVDGAGSFPGVMPDLPDYSASQLAGYSTAYTSASGVVVPGGSIGYADPVLGQRVPYYQNYNVGVQRAITRTTTLSASYVAGLGHFVPGSATRGYWTNKLDPKYLALGAQLSSLATPANVTAAQQLFPGIGLPYPTFGGPNATIAQMLLPFPQYAGVSDLVADVGNTAYHSMQLTLGQRTWNGVTFTLNYNYAVARGDVDDSRSAYPLPPGLVSGLTATAPAHSLDYSWQSNGNKQALTMYGVWALPFGRGRQLRGGGWLTRPVVDDWQFSSVFQYTSGNPVEITASKCVLVGQGTCFPDYVPGLSGSVRQNGALGSNYVAGGRSPQYLKSGVFQDPAPYMIGNVHNRAPYGLWSPGTYSLNASMRKSFPIREQLRFTFEADCFNVPNKVTFGYASTNIDASNFGQTNSGSGNRDWQFAGRIEF